MDLSKIKQRLDELNASSQKKGSNAGDSVFWKPAAGQNLIRILPNPYNKDWPFSEFFLYYGKFGKTIISPKSFGRRDPVIEFAATLKKRGGEDFKQALSLEPTARTFVALLVRGKEHEGPKFWNFGKTVFGDLLGIINDPDYGDITDLMTGRDLVIEYTPNDDPKLSKTAIRAKPNVTKAVETAEILEKIKTMQNPETIYKEPTYEELQSMFERYLAGDKIDEVKPPVAEKQDTADFDTSKYTPASGPSQPEPSKAESKKTLSEDILSEIDGMFDDIDV